MNALRLRSYWPSRVSNFWSYSPVSSQSAYHRRGSICCRAGRRLDFPFVAQFSDSQAYVWAAEQELGIYELRPDAVAQREVVQWHGLLASIEVSPKPIDQTRSP